MCINLSFQLFLLSYDENYTDYLFYFIFLPKYIYMPKPKGTGLICIVHQLDREKKIITRIIRQF